MIELITTKKEWNLLINEVDSYDFYSTYDYHALSNTNGNKPILIKFTQDDIIIGLPLIIRQIENTPFFDATSVYGYAGPISKNIPENFDNQLFKKELNEFFVDHRIVSVFSRLNPFLLHQNKILDSIGKIITKGEVVMIDLDEDLEVQRQQYQKRIKSHINKARRLCTIKKADSKEDITAFINLYYENMMRVDAKKSYFFNEDYFYKFRHIENCEIEILLASLNETNEIISGAMFIKTKDIIQYHLSGTKTDYLDTAALKLLIDEMRIEGTKENYKVFNLGGGLNSRDDSLLRFKKSFSKTLKDFTVWQYIVNEKIYGDLNKSVEINNNDFFPEYRSPS
jgi:hypothetical protein